MSRRSRGFRDIGNTSSSSSDEDTIRAADHIVEMGPGPAFTRQVVWYARRARCKASPTGQFFRQARDRDAKQRQGHGTTLTVRGRGKTISSPWTWRFRSARWSPHRRLRAARARS
jgi:excinuclease UvrABC ATPase subunit